MHALEYLWSLGEKFDAAALRRRVGERAKLYEEFPGLVSKAFLLDQGTRRFGGFYVWRTSEDADRFLESALFRDSRASLGEPEIRRFEIPAFVGPASETVVLPGKRLAFNHAMVYVKDVPRAVAFYAGQLGFRVIERMTGYARLEAPAGRSTLGIHQEHVEGGKEETGIRLYFELEGIEAFCEKLTGAGVELLQPPKKMPWGWTHAYLTDPEGHEISLYSAGEARFHPTM